MREQYGMNHFTLSWNLAGSRNNSKTFAITGDCCNAKKDSCSSLPITDCSRPYENSLNSYISYEKFSLDSVEKAFSLCKPRYFLAVLDIQCLPLGISASVTQTTAGF